MVLLTEAVVPEESIIAVEEAFEAIEEAGSGEFAEIAGSVPVAEFIEIAVDSLDSIPILEVLS